MARTTPRKVTPRTQTVGGMRPVRFTAGEDMELHGYWLPEKQAAMVEVPIFQHAFYPTLKHTDLDVRQNITYRQVKIPSLSTLRAHGIEAERAVFVAEVVVHPRYIKHNNYFRGDFPATVKTLARRENIVLLFAANDMPSARLKRKKVLEFWRLSFSPLLLKGRQYTAGRMGFFMVAPPGTVTKFKKSLNLENAPAKPEELEEWHPAVNRTRHPRKRGPRSKYTAEERRLANQLVKETSERLTDELLPLVTSKFDIEAGSKEAKAVEAYLHNPATSRELLAYGDKKKNTTAAARAWVKQSLWPRMKEIMKDEASMAGESAFRWLIQAVFTAGASKALGAAQATKFAEKHNAIQRIKFSRVSPTVRVGSGTLSYDYKANAADMSEMQEKVADFALKEIAAAFGHYEYNSVIASSFKITLDPNNRTRPVNVVLDKSTYNRHLAHNKEGLRFLDDEKKLNYLKYTVLPRVRIAVNNWFLKTRGAGDTDSYSDFALRLY